MLDRIHARLCWPKKKNPSGLTITWYLILTRLVCLSRISGGFCSLESLRDPGWWNSHHLQQGQFSWQRAREFWMFSHWLSNIVVWTWHMELLLTDRWPELVTRPRLTTGAQEVRIFPWPGVGKCRYLVKSTDACYTLWLFAVSQPVFSHCSFLPDSEGRHLPEGCVNTESTANIHAKLQPSLAPGFSPFLSVWHWANCFTSLVLSFLNLEAG